MTGEVKALKDWNPQLGDAFEFVSFDHSSGEHLRGSIYTIRDGPYGLKAYREGSDNYVPLNGRSLFKEIKE